MLTVFISKCIWIMSDGGHVIQFYLDNRVRKKLVLHGLAQEIDFQQFGVLHLFAK